jgi:hypothetical protein
MRELDQTSLDLDIQTRQLDSARIQMSRHHRETPDPKANQTDGCGTFTSSRTLDRSSKIDMSREHLKPSRSSERLERMFHRRAQVSLVKYLHRPPSPIPNQSRRSTRVTRQDWSMRQVCFCPKISASYRPVRRRASPRYLNLVPSKTHRRDLSSPKCQNPALICPVGNIQNILSGPKHVQWAEFRCNYVPASSGRYLCIKSLNLSRTHHVRRH